MSDSAIDVERLLTDLTDPQREAVTHTDGPILVLAGAGSGKTRVLTRRAAYLAATVTDPWHILAITFTNKAANEMRERIAALGVSTEMTVCTFHALCARLLRIHHERANLAPNFTIFDQADRRAVVKRAIVENGLAIENWPPPVIDERISGAKNAMQSPDEYEEQAPGFIEQTVARIYRTYEGLLAEQQALDFDDLLFKLASLLDSDESLRSKLENRYRYVSIDEYQDTNAAQYSIAHLLTRERKNLFVTGDPDQSIYGWRGADIGNILSFETDHPGARVVRLEQNYRSTKRILSAAGRLIAENQQRKEKALWTENPEGCPVRVIAVEDGRAEAQAVAEDISDLAAKGMPHGDIAVFYRINALSRGIEEAFRQGGIRYHIARGLAFYARKEIKDVLAYLRVMVNPADEVSLSRIINTPARGIGKTTVDRLKAFAADSGIPLYEAVRRSQEIDSIKRSRGRLELFVELLDSLQPLVEESARLALEQTLSLSGLRAQLEQQREHDTDAADNVDELISAAEEYSKTYPEASLIDWLSYTSLLGDVDMIDGDTGSVTLMTLHAAKGLEFPVVYIVGVEDGLLPLARGDEEVEDLEEERRLCFVGMTRAKERLTLSLARWRMLRGVTRKTIRSRFLDELPDDELEWIGGGSVAPTVGGGKPPGELPDDAHLWEVGTLVRHPAHGIGQVTALYRGARRTHVNVLFRDGHDGSWVLEFADLKRVDYDEAGETT